MTGPFVYLDHTPVVATNNIEVGPGHPFGRDERSSSRYCEV